jgi:aminoglycoside phosphotransferase (APT) family kinase protein
MRIDAESRARLARVLRAVRLPSAAAPVLLPSDSNDVWRIGPAVLRVCWRGDLGRFAREAAVTRALPAGVPYPEVLDTGSDGDLAWQVTRVVEGVPLARLWRGLSRAERRDAVHQIGQALATLHAHRFPADVVAALAAPRPVGDTSTLAAARHEGRADRALIDDVAARFRELADADPLGGAPLAEVGPLAAAALAAGGPPVGAVTCVHGDAHLANALWKDGRLTALLDFEWVRLGPPDLEIEPYLRADTAGLTDTELLREALGWLAESYPAMFAVPDLVRRLWLYQLANAVRELFLDRPGQPPDDGAQRQLHRIVKSPDHLLRILPARH